MAFIILVSVEILFSDSDTLDKVCVIYITLNILKEINAFTYEVGSTDLTAHSL